MATRINKSIIGDCRGTVGPVVLTESYGVGVVRSKPKKRGKKKQTDNQKKHTSTFSKLNKFFQLATDVINLGYPKRKSAKMSAFNEAVSWHFNNALAVDQTNGIVDFVKLKLSRPIKKTQKAWQPSVSGEENNRMTVAWKPNPSPDKHTHPDDGAVIVVHFYYRGRSKVMCYKDIAKRSDLNFSTELPYIMKGQEGHCYLFMISADKKLVSETQYLGKFTPKQ